MISFLPEAKNWCIDATFKVVCKPFTHLFSIHAFVKLGQPAKQIPLLFAIMSGKYKQDYVGVFSTTKTFLPAVNVKTITLDLKLQCCRLLMKCFLLLQDLDVSSTGLKL